MREGRHFADHGLAECVPWADKESVENLIQPLILHERMSGKEKVKLCIPDFPNVFIANLVCVNADKSPNGENLRSNYSEYFQLACRILLTKIQNTTNSNIWTNVSIISISDDVGSYRGIRLPSLWRWNISSEQAIIRCKAL